MRRLNFLNYEILNIHAAALVLGAAGLLSRLVGVLRNRLLFAEFGAGRELDIYYAAFQIPDFMAVLFLLGAASAAVLPIFQEYLTTDKKKAQEFIAALAGLFFLGSAAAALAAFFTAPFAVRFVAPGFSPQEQAFTATLARIMLLSPILFGLSGIFSVVVQSYRLFFVYALAPILYNLGIILGIVLLVPIFGVPGLGMGVVLGAAAHFGLQLGAAASRGFHFDPSLACIMMQAKLGSKWKPREAAAPSCRPKCAAAPSTTPIPSPGTPKIGTSNTMPNIMPRL